MSKLMDIDNIGIPDELPKINFYKEPVTYEVACSLFEACNLKCKFCFEGHRNQKIDIDYIRQIPFNVINAIRPKLNLYSSIKNVNIRLWGGELFFDSLSDSIFDEYKLFVDTFNDIFRKEFPHITLNFSWLTNGVFTKWERVKDILDYSRGTIGFSYDPTNRFSNDEQKQLMIDNVKRFHELKCFNCISITLTKSNIQAYIQGKSELLTELNLGEKYDINFYTANQNWETLLPSDDDIYNFFKWCIDNKLYYIIIINNLVKACIGDITPPQHYCDCVNSVQYSNGQATVDCVKRASTLPSEMFYGKYASIVTEENVSNVKLALGMVKRGCLECEYYNVCQMPCWITVVFEGFKPTYCPYKRAHEYIKSNPEIIEGYIEWIKENSISQ